jgi:hypothetical protein
MKIYKNGSELIKVTHNQPSIVPDMFLVSATQGDTSGCHISHQFIVAAVNSTDAIERVIGNAKSVIKELGAQATSEDLAQVQWFESASPIDIGIVKERLDALLGIEEPDELELLQIAELRSKLQELKRGKPTKKESQFDRRIQRMTYLLDPSTKFRAERIDGDRAIPVSYFDDSRDISSL